MRNKSDHIQVIQCTEPAIASLSEDLPTDTPVVMILPRHHATVRLVEFPSQDPSEVAQMAALAAEEMVPFSTDEIALSSVILTTLPAGASHVLIAIAHLGVVEQHLQQLRTAGYEAQSLYLSTACLLAAIENSAQLSSDSPQAFVHIERNSMDIIVMGDGRLRYNRGIEISNTTGITVEEIELALRSYTRESGSSIPRSKYIFHQPLTCRKNFGMPVRPESPGARTKISQKTYPCFPKGLRYWRLRIHRRSLTYYPNH